MKKILIANLLALSLLGVFTFSVTTVLAQPGVDIEGGAGVDVSPTAGGSVSFDNPLGTNATYESVVANVVQGILGLVGVAALIIFIYGGILWMTSLGNAERVKRGRETLIWGTLGIVVVFASFAVVNLILGALNTA